MVQRAGRMAKSKGQVSFGEAMRRSGLPLEYVVSQLLPNLGKVLPKGHFIYQMDSKQCDTDIWALSGWTRGSYVIEHVWFMDCKYRTPGKKWCFFPQAQNVVDLSENAFFFDLVESDKKMRTVKHRSFSRRFIPDIPAVGDGIELLINESGNWGTNEPSINNAIRQVTAPIANYIRNTLVENFILDYDEQWIELFLPVVVTTAEIQVLKNGIDWGTLSVFDRMEDCFEPKPAVWSVFTTPDFISDHWSQVIKESVMQLSGERTDMISKSQFLSSLGETTEEVSLNLGRKILEHRPTRTLIVQLDSLQSTLGDYLREVEKSVNSMLPAEE